MDFPGDRDGPLLRAEPPSGHPGAWVEPQAHPARRPPGDSRSDAVGCGQHPLGVDQGAPAVVPPVLVADSQAHLPGPSASRGLLPPDDARALQGLAWGRSRKPSTLGSSEPTTRPWACGGGGGQKPHGLGSGLTRGCGDQAQQEGERQQMEHLEGAGRGLGVDSGGVRSGGVRSRGVASVVRGLEVWNLRVQGSEGVLSGEMGVGSGSGSGVWGCGVWGCGVGSGV